MLLAPIPRANGALIARDLAADQDHSTPLCSDDRNGQHRPWERCLASAMPPSLNGRLGQRPRATARHTGRMFLVNSSLLCSDGSHEESRPPWRNLQRASPPAQASMRRQASPGKARIPTKKPSNASGWRVACLGLLLLSLPPPEHHEQLIFSVRGD